MKKKKLNKSQNDEEKREDLKFCKLKHFLAA